MIGLMKKSGPLRYCAYCGDEFRARYLKKKKQETKCCTAQCQRLLDRESAPAGLCPYCKKNDVPPGRKRCNECAERTRLLTATYRKRSNELFQCCGCGGTKRSSEMISRSKGGYQPPWCKECGLEKEEAGLKFCRTCLEWVSKDGFRKAVREKSDTRGTCKKCAVAQMYGMNKDEYVGLVESTGPLCPICFREFSDVPNGSERHVDHDHVTGQVRGIICEACNRALGLFGDSVDALLSAAAYLRNPPAMIHLGKRLAPTKDEPTYWEAEVCQI